MAGRPNETAARDVGTLQVSSTPASHLSWIAGGFLSAAAALSVVASLHVATPVDFAVPLYVLLLFCLAWIVRDSVASSAIAALAPLLVVLAAAVPSGSSRVALYGLTFAVAVVTAAAAAARELRLRLPEAIEILAIAIVPMRLVPFSWPSALEFAFIATGAIVLTVTLSREGWISIFTLSVVFGVAVATPFEPARASLFALLVALVVSTLRGASFPKLVGCALLALAAGRWAWPIAIVPVAASALAASAGEGGAAMFALPAIAARGVALLRVFAFAPAVGRRLPGSDPARMISALVLALFAIFSRSPLGALYALAVAAILAGGEGDDSAEWSVPTLAIVFVVLCLAGWSAVPTAVFPLPIRAEILVLISVAALAATLISRWRIAGAVAAALFAMFAMSIPAAPRERQLFDRALGAGQSAAVHLGHPRAEVGVVMSGANTSSLEPGRRIATIQLLDDRGRGYRRDVLVSEVADWAAFRPDQSFFTRNVFPAISGGRVVGWGADAFVTGAGRIELSTGRPISLVRVTADPSLPKGSVVQLLAIEESQ